MRSSVYVILLCVLLFGVTGCQTVSLNSSSAERAMRRENWESAVVHYTSALKKGPEYDLYIGRGTAYAKLGRYAESVDDFVQARSLRPNDGGVAAYKEARAALKGGFIELATEAADASLAQDDANTMAYYVRGVCAVKQKDYAKGKSSLLVVKERLQDNSDESIDLLKNLAIACFFSNDFSQARLYYDEYLTAKKEAGRYLLEDDYYWAGAIADVNLDDSARDQYWKNLSNTYRNSKGI